MAKVNTQHADYLGNLALWGKCRAFAAGSNAVKDAGETYLPKLGGHSDAEYKAYKLRAYYFNATGRTVDGMAGLVMRVDPSIKLPSQLNGIERDIDYQGTSLFEFAKRQVVENISVGRTGILVDFPETDDGVVTIAQAQAKGLRPYLAHYPAESIYNWRTDRINGATVLVKVVLKETVDQDTDDEFVTKTIAQFRVLDLFNGAYRQRIFRTADGDKTGAEWLQFGVDIFPTMGSKRLASIPFVFIGSETNTFSVQKPPIIDLVEANLAHYLNSAQHEHGIHFTGSPTPVITGHHVPQGESLEIGSETFLVLKSKEAKAFFMEFSGAGLNHMQSAMQDKKDDMATLGARMLAADPKGVEAAETARIHRSGEAGVLASLAGSVSKGILRALAIASEWAGAGSDAVEFELNKDFLPANIEAGVLRELVALWQSGGIAHADLFAKLKEGEIVAPDRDFEEMQDEIEQETPGVVSLPAQSAAS